MNEQLIKNIKRLIKKIFYFTYFEYLYQFAYFRSMSQRSEKSKNRWILQWKDR